MNEYRYFCLFKIQIKKLYRNILPLYFLCVHSFLFLFAVCQNNSNQWLWVELLNQDYKPMPDCSTASIAC